MAASKFYRYASNTFKRWAKRLDSKISPSIPGKYPNDFSFDDLTPIDAVGNSATYNEALQWALSNTKIKNVAMTGPYGSGKSSILKTFEKEHPEYCYLNISLASFQEEELMTASEIPDQNDMAARRKWHEKQNEMSQIIELSILQQMFYRVKDEDIPDSRFKRIRILSDKQLSQYIVVSLFAIWGWSILVFPTLYARLSWWVDIPTNDQNETNSNYSSITTFFLVL